MRALVVLDVPLVRREVRVHRALEAGEDPLGRVAHDVGQDVQPPAVGEADRDFLDAPLASPLEELVEERDRRLASLDRVAALPEILRSEEPLERLRREEFPEDAAPDLAGRRLGNRSDALPDPLLLDRVGDEAVLDAHLAAVDAAHHADDFPERHVLAALQSSGPELAVEVPDREPVRFQVELGMAVHRHHAERVHVRDQVAAHAVGVDELQHARLFLDLVAPAE